MNCTLHYNKSMNEHSFEFNTTIKVFPNGEKK